MINKRELFGVFAGLAASVLIAEPAVGKIVRPDTLGIVKDSVQQFMFEPLDLATLSNIARMATTNIERAYPGITTSYYFNTIDDNYEHNPYVDVALWSSTSGHLQCVHQVRFDSSGSAKYNTIGRGRRYEMASRFYKESLNG